MPVRCLSDQVKAWVTEALEKNAQGDDVSFDVSTNLLPAQFQNPATGMIETQATNMVVLTLMLPTGVVGLAAGGYATMALGSVNPSSVSEAILQLLEGARTQRSQMLADGQIPPPEVRTLGGNGLFIPGH